MDNNKKFNKFQFFFYFSCLFSNPVMSVEQEKVDNSKSPVEIPIVGLEIAPIFEINENYNDNIFQKNSLRKSSYINQIHAGAQLSFERQLNRYLLSYVMQSSIYHDSPADNYVDNYVGINTHTEFTSRNRLDFGVSYLDSHYVRGMFLGRDLLNPPSQPDEPDQYHLFSGDLTYQYGHPKNKGNMEVSLSVKDYTFTNNFDNTLQQDRTQYSVIPGFYYRLMPNTRLLTQVENIVLTHKYKVSEDSDYLKQRFLVGVTWDYSTKTVGTAKIGYLNQDYLNAKNYDMSGITWDINVRWLPLSYTKFEADISHNVTPSVSSIINLRNSDRVNLNWVHNWNSRITSRVIGAYEKANNSSTSRKDEFKSFGIDISYGFQRWLGLGISYNYRKLQSSDDNYDFDQNVVMLNLTGNPRMTDEAKSAWVSWY